MTKKVTASLRMTIKVVGLPQDDNEKERPGPSSEEVEFLDQSNSRSELLRYTGTLQRSSDP
jgi:hypothetical protein